LNFEVVIIDEVGLRMLHADEVSDRFSRTFTTLLDAEWAFESKASTLIGNGRLIWGKIPCSSLNPR
jgi:hypothetical protein